MLFENHNFASKNYFRTFENKNAPKFGISSHRTIECYAVTKGFSIAIVNLCDSIKGKSAIVNQLLRSGTSIGANIHEAQYAQGKKDFISKLEIALKEASETGYWLELLRKTNYIDEQSYKSLSSKCTSLRVMLIASCRTAKENTK